MATILVTGFGPFPGAPVNPSQRLVDHLHRRKATTHAGLRIVTHVFATSYAAVDANVPSLLKRHHPQALLMFGLAATAKGLRIERRARNTLAPLPDHDGYVPAARKIEPGGKPTLTLPAPTSALLAAARDIGVAASLSSNAGDYVCNYLCWRAANAAGRPGGPRLAAFIHLPAYLPQADAIRAADAFLSVLAAHLSAVVTGYESAPGR